MEKQRVIETIGSTRVLPVIRTRSDDDAKSVIDAVVQAGCRVVEITLSIPGAVELITQTAQRYPDIVVGAGTVSSGQEAMDCIHAGAKFIVSPWTDGNVIEVCRAAGILAMPGALTPTEVRTALRLGADVIKIFPVESMGGVTHIRALRSVLPNAVLIPTGGVTVENAEDFIRAGAFAVGIGSDLVSVESLRDGDHRTAVDRVRGLLAKMSEFAAMTAS